MADGLYGIATESSRVAFEMEFMVLCKVRCQIAVGEEIMLMLCLWMPLSCPWVLPCRFIVRKFSAFYSKGFIVVASCVMTFEARDSAAKVVPARFKMNSGRNRNSGGPGSRRTTSKQIFRKNTKNFSKFLRRFQFSVFGAWVPPAVWSTEWNLHFNLHNILSSTPIQGFSLNFCLVLDEDYVQV